MRVVTRDFILNENIEDYTEILKREKHHDHEIVLINDVYRWKQDNDVCELVEKIGLNDIICLFSLLGIDKNSEQYRQLYRDIGYSLSGYWEVFYWEFNNEDCDEYNPANN